MPRAPAKIESGMLSPAALEKAIHSPPDWYHRQIRHQQDARELSEIKVAVVDTGVARVPALEGKLLPGYDSVNRDNNPADDNGHGTHVASLIAAKREEGKSVYGVCQNCSILPVKVLDKEGEGTIENVIKGVEYSLAHGADIINLSLVFFRPSKRDHEKLQELFQQAKRKGVLVCAASGNDGQAFLRYPAAYEEVIAVGATTVKGERASYSNTSFFLDIMAPGGDGGQGLLSYTPTNTGGTGIAQVAASYHGTSMAAALVSGSLGILMGEGASAWRAWYLLRATATDIDEPGKDDKTGHGLVNLTAAGERLRQWKMEMGVAAPYLVLHDFSFGREEVWKIKKERMEALLTP